MTPFLLAALTAAMTQVRDTTATKSALLAADRGIAPAASPVKPDALLDRLEPGAVVLIPGEPILRGPQGARAVWVTRYLSPGTVSESTPLHAVASSDGRLGCTTGSTSVRAKSDTLPRFGRYLTCWRKGGDGGWRIVVHARIGEVPNVARPDSALALAPHSATGTGDDIDAALVADAAFARFALDAGPGPAFARFTTDDAMLLGGLPTPRRGREQIRAAFAAFPADQRLMWTPVRDAGAASGGLAVTVGTAAVGSPDGGPENGPSKYVTVWRQETDGSWRFVFDLGSPRPADSPADGHFPAIVRRQAELDSARNAERVRGARRQAP